MVALGCASWEDYCTRELGLCRATARRPLHVLGGGASLVLVCRAACISPPRWAICGSSVQAMPDSSNSQLCGLCRSKGRDH